MAGFILIGLTLMSGDLLPWTIRLLMVVGGAASFATPFVSGYSRQSDPGSSYPYPTQDDVLDSDQD